MNYSHDLMLLSYLTVCIILMQLPLKSEDSDKKLRQLK
jgi:hypothetical protein